jgi:hypothetical protein
MATLKTEWKSTKPNPDERHLKALFRAETDSLKGALSEERALLRLKQANILPLVKGSGLKQGDITKLLQKGAALSKKSLTASERQLLKPSFDPKALHDQDLKLAQANAELIKGPGNPSWSGYLWNASYGGWWMSWNGESEEVPSITFNFGAKRFDVRAQAWGEGWWDADFSKVHGYFAYKFNPPSWGHLHIYAYPWLHGYYSLYSDDEWYNGEYAKAVVDTWTDVHQNFWRSRRYHRRFTLAGDELHPSRSDRIDQQYGNHYYTNVGAGDTVTIRVGVHLYCYARASGGRAKLNFQAGVGNYVYVPYIYWYLHH